MTIEGDLMGLTEILKWTAKKLDGAAEGRAERKREKRAAQVMNTISAYFTYSDTLNSLGDAEIGRFGSRPERVRELYPELEEGVLYDSSRESAEFTTPRRKSLVHLLGAIPLHTLPKYDAETFNTELQGMDLGRRATERVHQAQFDREQANEAIELTQEILERFDSDASFEEQEEQLAALMNRYLDSDRNQLVSKIEDFGGFWKRERAHAKGTIKWAKSLDDQFHADYKGRVIEAAKEYKSALKHAVGFNTGNGLIDSALDYTVGLFWRPKAGRIEVDLTEDLEDVMRTYVEQRTRQPIGHLRLEQAARGRTRRNLAALALLAGAAGTAYGLQQACRGGDAEPASFTPAGVVESAGRPGSDATEIQYSGDADAIFQAGSGEGLWHIAQRYLGPEASTQDIVDKVHQIQAAPENADLISKLRDTVAGRKQGQDSLYDVALPVGHDVYGPNEGINVLSPFFL